MLENLYDILYKNENKVRVKLSDKEHPIFKAHFPDYPILAGFIHFEILALVFNLKIIGVKKAKFIHVVRPTQTLEYVKNGNKFSVLCEEKEVANFTLEIKELPSL